MSTQAPGQSTMILASCRLALVGLSRTQTVAHTTVNVLAMPITIQALNILVWIHALIRIAAEEGEGPIIRFTIAQTTMVTSDMSSTIIRERIPRS
jgi:hypothetical protein